MRPLCQSRERVDLPAARDKIDQIIDHLEFELPTDWLLGPLEKPGQRIARLFSQMDTLVQLIPPQEAISSTTTRDSTYGLDNDMIEHMK